MRGRRRFALVTLALALPSAACGARWTDDQRNAVADRYAGSTGAAVAASSMPSSSPVAGVGGGATGVTASAGAAGITDAATQATGAATGDGAATEVSAGAGGPVPCAAPSDAPGLSDRELVVGTISSLSGPVAGLGASAAAAARAYVAYRNSTGGVCGRQIVLREADDGTDNGRYRSIVGDLGPEVFGIAGGFALGDVGGADVVEQQALPVVNLASGEAAARLPTVFDINPAFEDVNAVIGKYRYLHDNGATKVAIAYIAVDQSRAEADIQRSLMEAAGIQVVLQQELPLSTLSYDATARAVANSGADYLWFIGDVNSEASMARSMADTGHELRFAEYYNFAYATPFVELAGAAADGSVAWLRSLPNEEAGANPDMSAFLDWMDQLAPGEALDPFAVDSWVSAKAFFDTLEALPGPITREAFVSQLQAIDTYEAGGMYGPIRLGDELTNGCVVGVRYEGGAWRRLAPDAGFLC